jgi:hypothetical protein
MSPYGDHIGTGELRLRRKREGRKTPIDHVAIEEQRHERLHLSEWLNEPIRDSKIKPLRLR